MVDTPYTRRRGPTEHERQQRVLTPVWVRLGAIYVRIPGAPSHVIDTGLDFTGEVPGLLSGWFPTAKGDWLGVVSYEVPYADGRRRKERFPDQVVPSYALRPRGEADEHPGSAPSA